MIINLEEAFTENNIYFELYNHRPIFTNEDALIIKEEQGFSGTETKSLFLKDKQKNNYVFVTFTTKQTDFKKLKQVVDKKLSMVSADQMKDLTGQEPGAVSPFGYEKSVPIIIDDELLDHDKLVFAPGRGDQTMVVKVEELPKIINLFQNKRFDYPVEN